ncbi:MULTISPECIES: nucleoside recognition domain-containing protein [unclassified Pedobacter]|uniref:nucleoside recognition domain-containing protein n=1 Tax=unclassified Pedobacter TaxID=2628915 RepID=UPI0014240BB0|nr:MULTISPECIES: nucleoside recognition domain-containing protein [unclassified Pedobacter]NII82441.1 spore maturation protein SpmA/spore maturation protein SpmB [Pedobacter sp. SG908]NMN36466.1 spore maturation protein SpmA/spore maturation protein SpmB [Pedobacter sp. SG918]
MALSRIWSAFIIVAIVVASIKCFFFGHSDIFNWMVIGKSSDPLNPLKLDGIIETCWIAVDLCIKLIGTLALFMGLMSIAEKAGGIRLLSRIIGPFFSKLFPEIPKGHPSMGHMIMNFSANLLGLDNAATPFGIKAMESLQELNPNKDVASNSQIMFLCLHAAGLCLIPVSVIAIRSTQNAQDPTDIFIPCLIVTFVGTMAAMFIVSFKQKINLLQPVIITWVLSISAVVGLLVWYVSKLNADSIKSFSGLLSGGIILLIFLLIVLGALYKKIDVFDAFIDGAKGGFETALKIIPYLVGILVAVSMLRTSGTFDVVMSGIKNVFVFFGADTKFVDALPTALIRPLSGGAARGMMVSTMISSGPDSFASKLSGVFQGASDTTFYVVAVYFGSVGIKNTRYAIGSMLLADLVGVCTAIALSYMFFA